jgi:hypothetical protein
MVLHLNQALDPSDREDIRWRAQHNSLEDVPIVAMSVVGHSHRFDSRPATSGLPR